MPMDWDRLVQYARSSSAFRRGYSFARSSASAGVHSAPEQSKPGYLANWCDAHTGRGLWKSPHYCDVYERHLAKFRGQEVHVLEIGVYSGGSLQMWKEYFGDKARIYGVDIEPTCRQFEDDQTRILIGDQADKGFWNGVLGEVPRIDVVIDDGGHQTYQQVATLEALLPHLQPGGVFIVEDIAGQFNPFHSYLDGLSRELHEQIPAEGGPPSVAEFPLAHRRANGMQRLVDSIHTYPFMTVIEVRSDRREVVTFPRCGTEWTSPTKSAPWAPPEVSAPTDQPDEARK